jgi:hypothetical protein
MAGISDIKSKAVNAVKSARSISRDTILIGGISVILAMALVGAAAMAVNQGKETKSQEPVPQNNANQGQQSQSSQQASATPQLVLKEVKDTDFATFTSAKAGFSLKLPKTAFNWFGGCEFNNKTNSFNEAGVQSTVRGFEDIKAGIVYIGFDHYYQMLGKKQQLDDKAVSYSTYSDCKPIQNSTDLINSRIAAKGEDTDLPHLGVLWQINYQKIAKDEDLVKFIQANHGDSCKLVEKKEITPNVFDLIVEQDDTITTGTRCPLNYNYILTYNSAKKYAVSWNIGQSDFVFKQYNNEYKAYVNYDDYIVKSFKFE